VITTNATKAHVNAFGPFSSLSPTSPEPSSRVILLLIIIVYQSSKKKRKTRKCLCHPQVIYQHNILSLVHELGTLWLYIKLNYTVWGEGGQHRAMRYYVWCSVCPRHSRCHFEQICASDPSVDPTVVCTTTIVTKSRRCLA
jgi:hypothetical protein